MKKATGTKLSEGKTAAKPPLECASPCGPSELARTLSALADPIRLRIIHLMLHREVTSQQCERVLECGRSVICQHLTCLHRGRLLARRRRGRITYYSVRQALSSTESAMLRLIVDSLQAHSGLLQADIDVLDALSLIYTGRVQLPGRPLGCSTAPVSLPVMPNDARILNIVQAGGRSLFSRYVHERA